MSVSATNSNLEVANYKARAKELLADAMECNINAMQQKAVIDYKELYDRASVTIEGNEELMNLPTDERILNFNESEDPSIDALHYNYGRYLMLSPTRPRSLPPDLQGLWAHPLQPP